MALDCDELEADAECIRDIFISRGRSIAHMMSVLAVLMAALLESAPRGVRAKIFEHWCHVARREAE